MKISPEDLRRDIQYSVNLCTSKIRNMQEQINRIRKYPLPGRLQTTKIIPLEVEIAELEGMRKAYEIILRKLV